MTALVNFKILITDTQELIFGLKHFFKKQHYSAFKYESTFTSLSTKTHLSRKILLYVETAEQNRETLKKNFEQKYVYFEYIDLEQMLHFRLSIFSWRSKISLRYLKRAN